MLDYRFWAKSFAFTAIAGMAPAEMHRGKFHIGGSPYLNVGLGSLYTAEAPDILPERGHIFNRPLVQPGIIVNIQTILGLDVLQELVHLR